GFTAPDISRERMTKQPQAVAVLVLAILSLVLVGVLIWRAFFFVESDCPKQDENPMDLKWRFPGYFRTPDEQAEFEQIRLNSRRMQPVYNVSTSSSACYAPCNATSPYYNTTPTVPAGKPGARRRRRRRQSGSTYASYDDDEYLPSAMNPQQLLHIAQGIGNLHQYFETEHCCQVAGCTACQCEQTYYTVSAVVHNDKVPNSYRTDWVRVPGCCKCINRN
ncbi:hypothetical protein BaRGS_00001374, partial [Batillaria attramentaria]